MENIRDKTFGISSSNQFSDSNTESFTDNDSCTEVERTIDSL